MQNILRKTKLVRVTSPKPSQHAPICKKINGFCVFELLGRHLRYAPVCAAVCAAMRRGMHGYVPPCVLGSYSIYVYTHIYIDLTRMAYKQKTCFQTSPAKPLWVAILWPLMTCRDDML